MIIKLLFFNMSANLKYNRLLNSKEFTCLSLKGSAGVMRLKKIKP